jgi:alpha-2-macroglobulin
MRQAVGSMALRLLAAAAGSLILFAQATGAAERRLLTTEGADYFGLDYEILRDVDLQACESACLADDACQAFTYNTRAGWCFLKADVGELRAVEGAVAGRVVLSDTPRIDVKAQRTAELGFVPGRYLDEARRLEGRLGERFSGPASRAAELLAQAKQAEAGGDRARALELYRAAAGMAPERLDVWQALATTSLMVPIADGEFWSDRWAERTGAAIAAYLRAETEDERAPLLALIARTLEERQAWKPALAAYRASLAVRPNEAVEKSYSSLFDREGFRIIEHTVDAETASPRICVQFSEPLAAGEGADASAFVSVGPDGNYAVEAEGNQLCIDGVGHGRRYSVNVRSGLPSAEGEALPRSVSLDIYVPDRAPSVRFLGNAYVLPAGGEASIPLVSVNAETIEAEVLRVGDRQLAHAIGDGSFLAQLYQYQTQEIAERTGESVWKGTVEVARSLNREVTTAVPVSEMVPELKPGAYLMVARAANEKDNWGPAATQWFVVSDLGLSTLAAQDGLHVFVRSLGSAGPVAGVELRLVAANNEILGHAETDVDGYARFAGGLIRGKAGSAPALIAAEAPQGDYNLLDLTRPALDLTDRGVEGRAPPGPLDVYLTTERGIYRAGEPVHVTALVRDSQANAVAGAPLTAILTRPDGVEQTRFALRAEALGGAYARVDLPANAMRGAWRLGVHADPEAPPLAQATFLVEDFQPERLDFELTADTEIVDPAAPPEIALAARFLYGQPAAGLSVEGEVVVRRAESVAAFPGYRFGLDDDVFEALREPLDEAETDEEGRAALTLALPALPATSRPLEAGINIRVVDPGGMPVERNLTLPVAAERPRIGVRPLFEEAVEENSEAAFQVIAVAPDGERLALEEVSWTLVHIDRRFQWYQADGRWDYEAIESRSRVADGTIALSEAPARIAVRPEWGAYALELRDPTGRALPASVRFEAGWYVEAKAADTPEALRLSLDKPRYRIGETARVHIESREPGIAQVMVLDDRVVDVRTVEVPEGGADIDIPVTRDWGPGAYVTAALYRPMDLAARRMPARALGLAWAEVDPGDRRLAVALDLPEAARPREPFEVTVALENVARGEEVYVTLAAVDLGILNLTRYEAPAPDTYYFGQRRLGAEIRDVYGQLIDRMQGARGRVRSGGDAPLARFEGPPPTETLVALHSGIIRVGEDGAASVTFDMPDFNGTVRVMAMAWSREGVGHATADVLVRDPLVVSLSRPSFLAPGDGSRLLIDLATTEESEGPVTLSVAALSGAVRLADGQVTRELELARGERREVRVPLDAVSVGQGEVSIALTLADGTRLEKRATVAVRDNRPENVHATFVTLAPGGSLRLGQDTLAGFLPGSAVVDLSVSGAGRLNLPAIVGALDRFPYGCTEQIASRALPLVYLDEVTLAAGLRGDPAVRKRVEEAISGVLANQSATGGFGLWGPGGDDLWLDAYIADFLTRARRHGFAVPDAGFDRAIDNLRNRLAYVPDFDRGGEDIAYALYVLAANGRAAIGDLRYYAETKLDAFATPLAKAQIGAALALYGDKAGADAVFRRAAFELRDESDDRRWRPDYGSGLRDAAAVLTLASETGTDAVDLAALSDRVEARRVAAPYTSTQEDAWTLLAAHALIRRAAATQLAIDGQAVDGPLFRSFTASEIEAQPGIENRGAQPVEVAVTVTGISETPEPAGGNFYAIDRAYYTLEGEPADSSAIAQGERLVAVLTVSSQESRAARLIVNDPLPAGLAIDNPHLLRSGEVAALEWLDLPQETAHVEFRADRFVAALDRGDSDASRFQLAYIVRAVAPGRFAHPAAVVEDMYRPERRARTATGAVEVFGPLR